MPPASSHDTSATAHATQSIVANAYGRASEASKATCGQTMNMITAIRAHSGLIRRFARRYTKYAAAAENASEGSRSAISECPMTPFDNHRMR